MFEFCKVCNINHDQGGRHKYFPTHRKALSRVLSKFHSKLDEFRTFLKNAAFDTGAPLPSRTSLWCIFCDFDIDDSCSDLPCENSISHLACEEHYKKVKQFLWKYGRRESDQADTFCLVDSDLQKWKAKFKSLKTEAGMQVGSVNYIRNKPESIDSSYASNVTNSVLPLHNNTHEFQISTSGIHTSGEQHLLPESCSVGLLTPGNGRANQCGVLKENCHGYNCASKAMSMSSEKSKGSMHSGAPPPWLDSCEGSHASSSLSSVSKVAGKSKLNPKRVGAAWAERRKAELQMEKTGEIPRKSYDPNWLPNFGRVWQSGSRKESLREFEKEKKKTPAVKRDLETSDGVQPYISKRMRKGSDHSRP